MNRSIQKAINIRPNEGVRTALMVCYALVVITSYNVLKPMTRSLFVSNLGLEQLPYLYIVLAGVVGVVVVFYMRLSASMRLNRLVNGTNLFLVSNLLFFRWLLGLKIDAPWLYYMLFIWASIYGVLTTTQFWLLANYLFDAREAKRIFPLLAAGAIAGGIAGGYFTRIVVKQIGGTENLAFVCIGFLVLTIILMNFAWERRKASTERTHAPLAGAEGEQSFKIVSEAFKLFRNSRHLSFLMAIVFLTFFVVQIADFQFVAFASERNSATDDLTGFLGFWLSTMSIIALVFQIFFSGYIVRRFGVGVTILFLPFALLLTSLGVFFAYGLVAILALKIGDGAFRHSINKVGIELLFLPIPVDVKKKTKAFVDMFADRLARGFAGVVLLIFYSWLHLTIAQISLVSIAAVLVWIALSSATYREYVNSFRQAIAKRQIDAELLSVSINDEETINSLIVSLGSRNERQVVYGLKLLESVRGVELLPPILPLLKHKSPEVRLHTLHLIYLQNDSDIRLWPHIEPFLYDDNIEIRREAIRFYATFSKGSTHNKLSEWLRDEDRALRGATLFYIADEPKLAEKLLDTEMIRSFIENGREGRIQAADALGTLNDEKYYPFLTQLLEDSDDEVKTHAIKSAGKTRDKQFVPALLQHLKSRSFRKQAREALAQFGDSITEILADTFCDIHADMRVRLGIPRILSLVGSQRSVDILLDCLDQKEEPVRYQVIKALNKLRAGFSNLKFDNRVDDALTDELMKYFRVLAALHVTDPDNGADADSFLLLRRVLQERLDDHIDRVFRLLGLRYPPRDIYNAYAATLSRDRTVRANAVEFLDNILSSNLKRVLLPIVEELPPEQVLQKANGLLKVDYVEKKDALRDLINDPDPLVRACALYEIGQSGLVDEFRREIQRAKTEDNTLVQETAELVMTQNGQVSDK
ncbi:MAG: Npt1/Npt2 family nucleotide transporter [bacterium]